MTARDQEIGGGRRGRTDEGLGVAQLVVLALLEDLQRSREESGVCAEGGGNVLVNFLFFS